MLETITRITYWHHESFLACFLFHAQYPKVAKVCYHHWKPNSQFLIRQHWIEHNHHCSISSFEWCHPSKKLSNDVYWKCLCMTSLWRHVPWKMSACLNRCWWRMLETKCVGDKFEILVTSVGDEMCWWQVVELGAYSIMYESIYES